MAAGATVAAFRHAPTMAPPPLSLPLAARLIATAGYLRCESRGGHFRSDYPMTDPSQAERSRLTLPEADRLLAALEPDEKPLKGQIPES